MGRPKKQTVDYFPHICRHGKTIFILEEKYGNDGYAFWFKLLELLGDTEGHYIDCNNPATWEFLQSKTRLPEDTCLNILNLLSRLAAIDLDLWQNRIIWSENFIKGIAEVYRNRRVETPSKPDNYIQKPTSQDQSTRQKRQSRVEKSRVKERKEYTRDFLNFYEAYPRKINKEGALIEWEKLSKNGGLPSIDTLLGALEQQKAWGTFDTEPRFIVYPERWLKNKRWEDKQPQAVQTKKCPHDLWPEECRICKDYIKRPQASAP